MTARQQYFLQKLLDEVIAHPEKFTHLARPGEDTPIHVRGTALAIRGVLGINW